MRLNRSDIAVELIGHTPRLRHSMVDIEHMPREERAKWIRDFTSCIDTALNAVSVDSIGYVTEDFFRQHRSYPDWINAAITYAGVKITFDDGAPVINQGGMRAWRALTSHIDADCLIAYAFVHRFGTSARRRHLPRWETNALSADRDLQRLFTLSTSGINLLHTHLHGCPSFQLHWLRVVTGRKQRQDFPFYQEATLRGLHPDSAVYQSRLHDIWAIRRARSAWAYLMGHLKLPSAGRNQMARSPIAQRLWPERTLLMTAWQAILHPSTWPCDVPRHDIMAALDAYTYGKSRFLRTHIQRPGTNPGFANFRRYFPRGKVGASRNSLAAKEGRYPPAFWRDVMEKIEYACESAHIRRQEFRIAPFNTQSQYAAFFSDFESTLKRHDRLLKRLTEPDPTKRLDIGFIVHFIRANNGFNKTETPVAFARQRHELDLQSVELFRFRNKRPDLSRWIVGIDVCNTEKGQPIDLFTPYLHMLRGDLDFSNPLTRFAFAHSPYMRRWRKAAERHPIINQPNLPRLGLTLHAGEDYFHPIDGMRMIWQSIFSVGMDRGDRIGHGLALGADLARFEAQDRVNVVAPEGEILDGLVWLRSRLGGMPAIAESTIRCIDDEIAHRSRHLYETELNPVSLAAAQTLRHLPALPAETAGTEKYLSEGIWKIYRLEQSESHQERRNRLQTLPNIFNTLLGDLQTFQCDLLDTIAKRSIIIETNPTSNHVIGLFDDMADHPLFRMKELNPGVRLTINCDNPGTFDTRPEIEFALIGEAALARDMPRESIQELLDNSLKFAEEGSFLSGTEPRAVALKP